MTEERWPRRLLLLVNPKARTVSPARVQLIEKALSADFDLEVAETARRGHGAEAAAGAVAAGFDVLVVFSGDGTINEVVNGIAMTDTALGIIPGGATNVLSRVLGIPQDPVEAATTLIRHALEARARRMHLGRANGRYFAINCGVGLDAAVMSRVEAVGPRTKLAHERVAFFAALREVNSYIAGGDHLLVRVDGRPGVEAKAVLIAKQQPYAYFKSWGLKFHPRASGQAGLDVLALRKLSSLGVPRLAWQVFAGGLETNRNVDYSHDAGHVEVRGRGAFPVQVDGEYVGTFTDLGVELVRDALWVIA